MLNQGLPSPAVWDGLPLWWSPLASASLGCSRSSLLVGSGTQPQSRVGAVQCAIRNGSDRVASALWFMLLPYGFPCAGQQHEVSWLTLGDCSDVTLSAVAKLTGLLDVEGHCVS